MTQPYDFPLQQLRTYKPESTRRPDFDEFWSKTQELLNEVPADYELIPYDYPSVNATVYRIRFTGFNGAYIGGWYVVPKGELPLPGLVMYHGYNWAHDGNIHEAVNMALHGYVVLLMLTRGQQGDSVDNVIASGGSVTGWLTKGIQRPEEYYYRAVYMDAVRAVEILASMKEVNRSRIGVIGGSQGGALTLAAAAFSNIPVVACADYPAFGNFERIIDAAPQGPYHEFNEYFRRYSDPRIEEQAKITLSYHDMMNIAPRIRCYTFVSIGLVDMITPPSTIFAIYNHLSCPKEISVHRYYGHEFIPGAYQSRLKLLQQRLQQNAN